MSNVNVKLKLANPVRPAETDIETSALVDTGTTFTTIPRHMSEKLGLRTIGKRRVRTVTQFETFEQSFASVEIDGNLAVTPILISDTLDKILVGVITLEALGLTVNPTSGQLKEAETYLL